MKTQQHSVTVTKTGFTLRGKTAANVVAIARKRKTSPAKAFNAIVKRAADSALA